MSAEPLPAAAREPDPTARLVYLHPGQLVASGDHVIVTTVLGSCVAVCLFDENAGVGGVNHFVLPAGAEKSPRIAAPRRDCSSCAS